MTPDDSSDIAAFLARSAGAQTRQHAIDSIKARRAKLLGPPAAEPEVISSEPVAPAPVDYTDPPPPPEPKRTRKPRQPAIVKRPTRHEHLSVIDGHKEPPKAR